MRAQLFSAHKGKVSNVTVAYEITLTHWDIEQQESSGPGVVIITLSPRLFHLQVWEETVLGPTYSHRLGFIYWNHCTHQLVWMFTQTDVNPHWGSDAKSEGLHNLETSSLVPKVLTDFILQPWWLQDKTWEWPGNKAKKPECSGLSYPKYS